MFSVDDGWNALDILDLKLIKDLPNCLTKVFFGAAGLGSDEYSGEVIAEEDEGQFSSVQHRLQF